MQSIPLAVLKQETPSFSYDQTLNCMQSIPLAVLKPRKEDKLMTSHSELHAIHTACGIETPFSWAMKESSFILHAIHTACGVEKGQVCAENP